MAFESKDYLYIANWSAGRIDRYRSGLDPFQHDSVLTVDYGGKGLYRISLTDGKTEQLTDKPISPVGETCQV